MIKAALLAVPVLWCSGASAIGSRQLDVVRGLPVEHRFVESCGSWSVAERGGHYRIVVDDVDQGAGSEIYVQWILDALHDAPSRIVATAPIAELNNDHSQYSIVQVACGRRGRSTFIKVKATYEHDETDRIRSMEIQPTGVGRYRLIGDLGR